VVTRGQRIYRSSVNYSEMEGSYEYTDRFRLTSVKIKELLNTFGPFLLRVNNRSRALSEKQLLLIALHWLGTAGQYHSVCDTNGVFKARACTLVLISDVTL
jgi:hypothetical protein